MYSYIILSLFEPLLFLFLYFISGLNTNKIYNYIEFTKYINHSLLGKELRLLPYAIITVVIVIATVVFINSIFYTPIPSEYDEPNEDNEDNEDTPISEDDTGEVSKPINGTLIIPALITIVAISIPVILPGILRDMTNKNRNMSIYPYIIYFAVITIICIIAYCIIILLYRTQKQILGITENLHKDYHASQLLSSYNTIILFITITLVFVFISSLIIQQLKI